MWCFARTFLSCMYIIRPVATFALRPGVFYFGNARHGRTCATFACILCIQYFWMEPLLQDLGELSEEETDRILQDLLPASRPLGELLLRYRPSRQLQNLQPIPTLFWYFWCGELWPFCPQSLQENFWYHLRELAQEDSHLRELLRLVDQGIGDFLLREVQAELVQTSRRISDLRRRVTYLSLCSLGIKSDPLFIPQLLPEPLLRRSRL